MRSQWKEQKKAIHVTVCPWAITKSNWGGGWGLWKRAWSSRKAETKIVQKIPRGSGGWEEPRGSQNQDEPDVGSEISQDEAPGQRRGREELWRRSWRNPRDDWWRQSHWRWRLKCSRGPRRSWRLRHPRWGSGRPRREPERLRMKEEPEGRRSQIEPDGQSDEAKLVEWSPEAADGQQLTKVEPEGRRSLVEPVGWWATLEMRELGARSQGGDGGSKDRGGVQDLETGGGDGWSSRLGVAGGWQSWGGSECLDGLNWGWTEGLTGTSRDRTEDLAGFKKGGGRGRLGGSLRVTGSLGDTVELDGTSRDSGDTGELDGTSRDTGDIGDSGGLGELRATSPNQSIKSSWKTSISSLI